MIGNIIRSNDGIVESTTNPKVFQNFTSVKSVTVNKRSTASLTLFTQPYSSSTGRIEIKKVLVSAYMNTIQKNLAWDASTPEYFYDVSTKNPVKISLGDASSSNVITIKSVTSATSTGRTASVQISFYNSNTSTNYTGYAFYLVLY